MHHLGVGRHCPTLNGAGCGCERGVRLRRRLVPRRLPRDQPAHRRPRDAWPKARPTPHPRPHPRPLTPPSTPPHALIRALNPAFIRIRALILALIPCPFVWAISDGTLNPGGVRFGSAEIYNVLTKVPEIADSLVVGQKQGNDERVVLFITLAAGAVFSSDLEDRIRYAAPARQPVPLSPLYPRSMI